MEISRGVAHGPYMIGDYLRNLIRHRDSRPPDASGVYFVSELPWYEIPTRASGIIYVGQARYLRRRIGQLLGDLLGFTGDDHGDGEAYEHRGGHFLWHNYGVARELEPSRLYLGWCSPCACVDCAEVKLREMMETQWTFCSIRPCESHTPTLELFHNCSISFNSSINSVRFNSNGNS